MTLAEMAEGDAKVYWGGINKVEKQFNCASWLYIKVLYSNFLNLNWELCELSNMAARISLHTCYCQCHFTLIVHCYAGYHNASWRCSCDPAVDTSGVEVIL